MAQRSCRRKAADRPFEMAPVRFEPFTKARDQTDAGDPHLAAFRHLMSSLIGKSIRAAHSINDFRKSGLDRT